MSAYYHLSDRQESKLAYLDITSLVGVSIGARHYYGKLIEAKSHVQHELYRVLRTQADVDRLNSQRTDFDYDWRIGERTSGFDTPEKVKAFALRHYKTYVPKATVILIGRGTTVEPLPVLLGPKVFKDLSRRAIALCDKLGWYDDGNDEQVEKVTALWYGVLKAVLNNRGNIYGTSVSK